MARLNGTIDTDSYDVSAWRGYRGETGFTVGSGKKANHRVSFTTLVIEFLKKLGIRLFSFPLPFPISPSIS